MSAAMVVLAVLVAALFTVTGAVKVAGLPASVKIRDRLGVPAMLWPLIGLLECAGALGVLAGIRLPWLGVAAATGLCVLMLGAIASRLRVRDRPVPVLLDVAVLTVAAAALVLRAAGH